MARGASTPPFMGTTTTTTTTTPPAKAYLCLLLLTLSGCFLSTTAHVARSTTTDKISPLCGEGSGAPCSDSLEPASPGTSATPGTPGTPGIPEGLGGPGDPWRGLIGIASAAPTPSPSALVNSTLPSVFLNSTAAAECEEESAACLEDEECEGCYEIASGNSSSVEFEACREAYLGGGSSPSTCDVAGATYCCSNEISESDCLAGDMSSLYWGCVFEAYGCELEEVACLAVGDSYRSDDDDVGGRASNPSSGGAGKATTLWWSSGVGCAVAAALVATTTASIAM